MNGDFILNKYKDIDLGEGAEIFILDENGRSFQVVTRLFKENCIQTRILIQKIRQHREESVFSFRKTLSGTPYSSPTAIFLQPIGT